MLVRIVMAVDPPELSERVERLLERPDVVVVAGRGKTLWERLARESCDLVIVSDDVLGDEVGDAIGAIRRLPDRPEVIALLRCEEASRRASLQAAGAFASVNSRLDDEMLGDILLGLLKRRREVGVARLGGEQRHTFVHLNDLSTQSPSMRQLLRLSRRVAPTESSLLIVGETGVGKEWLARSIHAAGPRASAPFIAVNCPAIPESLLESELFGHEKGAFTNAIQARRGFFELAHRGTLFLDEIGEMPMHLQAKLLRVLQDRRIQRIGSEVSLEVDVRIIAATNRDLEQAIQTREFRRDLYYRLGVVTLLVPPLRERREDVPQLVDEYVHKFSDQLGRSLTRVSNDAMQALIGYGWPGNVRELSNVIERAVLLAHGTEITHQDLLLSIARTDVPDDSNADGGVLTFGAELFGIPLPLASERLVGTFEREYFKRLLRATEGNLGETASRAGVDPRTLFNKMKRYELKKEDFKG